MRVLVFERNLMWSARLARSLQALGHEAVVLGDAVEPLEGDAAIVNLGAVSPDPVTLVKGLKVAGIPVIGHAGHKEKELLALGRECGCDVLSSNSELTFKLADVLRRAVGRSE